MRHLFLFLKQRNPYQRIQTLLSMELERSCYMEPYLFLKTPKGYEVGIVSRGKYRKMILSSKEESLETWKQRVHEVGGLVLSPDHPVSWWQEVLHHVLHHVQNKI